MPSISSFFSEISGSKSSYEKYDKAQKIKSRTTALMVALLAIPIITTSIPIQLCSSLSLVLLALFSTRLFPVDWKKIGIVGGSTILAGMGIAILEGITSALCTVGTVSMIASIFFDAWHDSSNIQKKEMVYHSTLIRRTIVSVSLGLLGLGSLAVVSFKNAILRTKYAILFPFKRVDSHLGDLLLCYPLQV